MATGQSSLAIELGYVSQGQILNTNVLNVREVGGLPKFLSLFHQLCFWSIYSQMQMFWTLAILLQLLNPGQIADFGV